MKITVKQLKGLIREAILEAQDPKKEELVAKTKEILTQLEDLWTQYGGPSGETTPWTTPYSKAQELLAALEGKSK